MKKTGEVEMTRQKARGRNAFSHRLTRLRTPESAGFYQEHLHGHAQEDERSANRNIVLDCGWGRLLSHRRSRAMKGSSKHCALRLL